MKKVIATCAFAVLGVIALSSCNKDYECTCVDPSGTYTETASGSDAEDACNGASSVLQLKTCVPA